MSRCPVFGVALAIGSLTALACSGQIGDDASQASGTPAGTAAGARVGAAPSPGSPAQPGSSSTANVPPPTAPPSFPKACGTIDPGYVGLRRLTRVEYNNTVRDLLGDSSRPALAFPNDDSILAAQSHVSGLYFEKHENAAERLINESWARESTGKQPGTVKVMVCPLKAGDAACARNIITSFAKRAWRRPVTTAEIDPYMGLVTLAEKNGEDIAAGVRLAMQGVLEALDFLFKVEPDAGMAARPLTAHEFAVRLSYLLWSTMPDGRLVDLADKGTLTQPAVMVGEMIRMLADPKAAAFAEGFVGHWLSLASLDSSQPDPTLSGGFDEPLRQAMVGETLALFTSFLNDGLKLPDIMSADFSFLNERLGRHYGVTLPKSAIPPGDLRRVSLVAGPRRGLLAQGGLLTMTSGPTSTSPVKRGKFVSTFLLCTAPPTPPPGADTFLKEAGLAKTERERLKIHRANPQCAACHTLMDPIGLAMENFDLVGRHRQSYGNGSAIDASGELAGGGKFTTFEDLRALLAVDPRVPGCVATQLFTYAIGRAMSDADECVRKAIMDRFMASGRMTDLLSALVGSPPFAQRRPESAGGSL